ncbi:MAG: hypothetical protein CMJ89_05260 [Planctomycetes bacterium]|nr:hypothetical protein [Planctomycetota bacterium]
MARVTVRTQPDAREDKADRIAFACLFLSGFLGLIYEIAWIRKASLVFGSATFALSTVVAAFLGGLALGSFLFGRMSARIDRPLRLYAKVEITLGILAVLSPGLFLLCDLAYGAFYPSVYESFPVLTVARAVLVSLAILPATFLMGATLPLFCRQYVTQADRISTRVGFLYGLNTLGAACGCFVGGFLLLPTIGVDASLYLAGVVNISLGAVVWTLAANRRVQTAVAVPERESLGATDSSRADRAIVAFLFLVSGGVILANEILWARFLTLLVSNTVYTYTLTLGIILLGIVLGAWLTARRFDRSQRRALHFGMVQVLSGLTVLLVLMLPASRWRSTFATGGDDLSLFVFALVLLVPAVLSGITFPLAVRMVVDQPRLASVGVGRMTAINTFGGIAGSLLAGFFLLPVLGLQASVRVTTGLSLVLGFSAWIFIDGDQDRFKKVLLGVASVALWVGLSMFSGTRIPHDFLSRPNDVVVEVREGRNGNLAVLQRGSVKVLEIDRLWQGEDRKNHQIMAAHIPMLLHPDPKDVIVIGLGGGQTASRFLYYDIERLDCVDIEAELFPLVRDHFEGDWLDDARTHLLIEDGRNYLSYTDLRYDIISVEVGQTFRPGVGSFYTREFYSRARERLKPNGLLSQFVPVMFLSEEECRNIVKTFLEVFPASTLWYNTGELLLVGVAAPSFQISPQRLTLPANNVLVGADLRWSHWGGEEEWLSDTDVFLGCFLMGSKGLRRFSQGALVYRDDLPLLDYSVSSRRDPEQELRIVERLGLCLQPVSDILKATATVDPVRTNGIREANLTDIRASMIARAAYRLRAEGKLRESRELLRRALGVNPRNAAIRLLYGDVLGALGRSQEAEREYLEALAIDSQDAGAHDRLGRFYLAKDDGPAALRHFGECVRLRPNDFEAALQYGRLLINDGRFVRASEILSGWVESRADDAELQFQLGRAWVGQGTPETAREHYERCLALDETRVEAHVNLGNLYLGQDDVAEAIRRYRMALAVRPDMHIAYYGLSIALLSNGQEEEAIAACENALRLNPELYQAYDHLGTIFSNQGRQDDAIEMFDRALEIQPNYSNAKNNLRRAKARR